MGLSSLLDRRPIVVALAGPNGSGKSTFFNAYLANTGLRFVNADVLALSLGMDAYAAAEKADILRRELVKLRESFIFETVFSDPVGDKLAFLKASEEAGYTVVLIFIGVSGPEISDERVAMRVLQGGHDVPPKKLVERFPRTMNNLKRSLAELSNIWVYDHSELDRGYRLVAAMENRQGIKLHEPTPEWLRALLP
ncbi:MAG: zeta toxin family protein [Terracidiphilus sp.]|nr:zeta toxin family protein [Terracidiphilus sp.]